MSVRVSEVCGHMCVCMSSTSNQRVCVCVCVCVCTSACFQCQISISLVVIHTLVHFSNVFAQNIIEVVDVCLCVCVCLGMCACMYVCVCVCVGYRAFFSMRFATSSLPALRERALATTVVCVREKSVWLCGCAIVWL